MQFIDDQIHWMIINLNGIWMINDSGIHAAFMDYNTDQWIHDQWNQWGTIDTCWLVLTPMESLWLAIDSIDHTIIDSIDSIDSP